MFLGFQHFKRVQFHHVSSTQWHGQDDSHMTIRYHTASVMSRDAWIHSITFQLNCYDPCRAMNDAESIWVILCWQGIFEMFQDPGPGKWGDQSCSVRWHQALAPHFLSISSTEILWDSVRFYIPQDLLDGVGVVASVRIVSLPNVYICLCQRHISGNFSFFCSFAHHSALPMTCRNFLFSRLSLFRCPVAAGLIWDRCLQAEHGNVQFLWWIQYRKYMKLQYIELFTHWITKIIHSVKQT